TVAHTHIPTYARAHTHTRTHTHTHTHTNRRMHTHTNTCTRTHTHKHTRTHTLSVSLSLLTDRQQTLIGDSKGLVNLSRVQSVRTLKHTHADICTSLTGSPSHSLTHTHTHTHTHLGFLSSHLNLL